MGTRVVDESDAGFGWIESARLRRTSHALVDDGRVWLVDPVDAPEWDDRILALGRPAGVIQLLDRHARDSAALSARLGVPLLVAPAALPGSPFALLPVLRNRWWREVALWWPGRRLLVCADALGTIPFFLAGDEPVGVHPFLRLRPPRSLYGLGVEQLLVGHGEGLRGVGTAAAVEEALHNARRRLPSWLAGIPRIVGAG